MARYNWDGVERPLPEPTPRSVVEELDASQCVVVGPALIVPMILTEALSTLNAEIEEASLAYDKEHHLFMKYTPEGVSERDVDFQEPIRYGLLVEADPDLPITHCLANMLHQGRRAMHRIFTSRRKQILRGLDRLRMENLEDHEVIVRYRRFPVWSIHPKIPMALAITTLYSVHVQPKTGGTL